MAHSSALPAPMHYDQTHYPNLARSTHQNYTQISLSKNNLQSALSFHNSTMPNMFDDSYRGCLSEDTPQLVLYSHKMALPGFHNNSSSCVAYLQSLGLIATIMVLNSCVGSPSAP